VWRQLLSFVGLFLFQNEYYGKQTIIDANLLFKHKGTTFGTASVKALGAPKMEASIEHEGTMFNNKARLQVCQNLSTHQNIL
jgi:hypothetical protein